MEVARDILLSLHHFEHFLLAAELCKIELKGGTKEQITFACKIDLQALNVVVCTLHASIKYQSKNSDSQEFPLCYCFNIFIRIEIPDVERHF